MLGGLSMLVVVILGVDRMKWVDGGRMNDLSTY